MGTGRFVRVAIPLVLLLAVAAIVVVLLWPGDDPAAEERSVSVGAAHRAGWQTLEYRDVRVDVPDAWDRLDTSDCAVVFEFWGPPTDQPCEYESGVMLAYMPMGGDHFADEGLSRSREDPSLWGGWIGIGDVEVHVGPFAERALTRMVLDTIRAS